MKKSLIILLVALLCLSFLACNQKVEFNINFVVDGNVYETINTNGKEVITVPENPTKEGYKFDGWYWDEGKWEKPFTANSLLDAPISSDMNVYAKWDEIDSNAKHTHVVVIDEMIAPTCTTDGFTEGKHCSKCNEVIVAQTRVDALGHTEAEAVVENNVAPDCITDGSYDSVVYCSVCSDEISRTSVNVDALGHNEETITGEAATCTETGLTDGVKCNTCGETLIEQSEIPAKGHTDLEPKDYICDVCNADLCTNHTEETIPAKSPTCTETGLTEGKKCSVCGDIIVVQEIVDALGHTEVTDKAVDATCTTTGLTEGKHCSICNETLVAQMVVGVLGHTEVIDKTVDATCTTTGLTEGKHCSICNETLVAQMVVGVLGHSIVNNVCTVCGYQTSSEGLEYTLNSDGESYSVSGIGTCTDADIVIPSMYENLPVTSIGECAFYECTSMTSVIIPNSITSIGSAAFYECTSMTSVIIPNSTTSIGSAAFYECTSMTSVIIPNSITSIGSSAFYGCTSITSIIIPDNVSSIGEETFYGCSRLASITIGNSVTSIGHDAFYYCISLTRVTIPNNVTSIASTAFRSCLNLTGIDVDINNEYYISIDGNLYTKDKSKLIQYAIGKIDVEFTIPDSVTSIGEFAFYYGRNLTNVNIPNSVTSISQHAFSKCKKLQTITIPDGVTSIANFLFEKCTSLTSVTIPDSVTSIGKRAFYKCLIASINIPDGVTSIGERAFGECTSLTRITIPDNVTSIYRDMFYGCTNLTNITIPYSVTSIGEYVFYNCLSLKRISYDGTVEEWETISKGSNWNYTAGNYTIYCTDGTISDNGTVTYHPDNAETLYTRDGGYIYFGEYPQTIKADDVTITSTIDERGYYLGSDGYYYAKIVADPLYSNYTFSTGETITDGEIYYFKVEPIRWRILSEDGETAFILCDSIIEGMSYDAGKYNNYAESNIRAWLNNEFYNTAFSKLQQEIILTTTVDNSAYSTGYDSNSNACEDTEDKVFLLSYREVTNSEYGFLSDLSIGDTIRCMQTSDYSRATNVFVNRSSSSDYGVGRWWLRSPYNSLTENVRYVNEQGSYNFTGADGYAIGVVPAIWITLNP